MSGLQRLRVQRIVAVFLMIGWGVAYATTSTLQREAPDLLGLPWVQIALGAVIACWGGAAATLGRYLSASYDNRKFRWRAEAVRDVVVSIAVGGGGYLAGWWYGLGTAQLGLVLLLSGVLGVRLLTTAAERLYAVVSSRKDA